jgi:hypothetical protein
LHTLHTLGRVLRNFRRRLPPSITYLFEFKVPKTYRSSVDPKHDYSSFEEEIMRKGKKGAYAFEDKTWASCHAQFRISGSLYDLIQY